MHPEYGQWINRQPTGICSKGKGEEIGREFQAFVSRDIFLPMPCKKILPANPVSSAQSVKPEKKLRPDASNVVGRRGNAAHRRGCAGDVNADIIQTSVFHHLSRPIAL
jgi:hypothetical protein